MYVIDSEDSFEILDSEPDQVYEPAPAAVPSASAQHQPSGDPGTTSDGPKQAATTSSSAVEEPDADYTNTNSSSGGSSSSSSSSSDSQTDSHSSPQLSLRNTKLEDSLITGDIAAPVQRPKRRRAYILESNTLEDSDIGAGATAAAAAAKRPKGRIAHITESHTLEDSSVSAGAAHAQAAQRLRDRKTHIPLEEEEVQSAETHWSPQGTAGAQPLKLLLVEAFAGSHPVGRHIQQLFKQQQQQQQQQQQSCAYSVVAYAAIEKQPAQADKFRPPAAAEMGLAAADTYIASGNGIEQGDVIVGLRDFVHSKLGTSALGVDAVVVLGGPPCTAYSQARAIAASRENELAAAQQAHSAAIEALLRAKRAAAEQPSAAAAAAAAAAAVELQEAQAKLDAAQQKHTDECIEYAELLAKGDSTVKTFLRLFKSIESECQQASKVHCYLIMENPYSKPDRALWNRPFMKQEHLLNLPDKKAARDIAQQSQFKPGKDAWLNTVFQNWCTYGPNYPQKDTAIFTNLPRQVFPDRKCSESCQRPDKTKREHVGAVQNQSGAYERAPWPVEFVGAALEACVQQMLTERS